ncbi:MAG: N-acetylglucosamine-6-phosphate deacetylase [Acidimicrobiia bacterium]|nr:N-acetylglucosamine-6-phosphate deacetylase [Acidimicrobiia bacterium]
MTLLAGGRVVAADGVLDRGWVSIADGRIEGVGTGTAGRAAVDVTDHWILPGFVDLHVHGGGGHSVLSGDPRGVAGTVEFHSAHGTTTTLVSLVTAPGDALVAAAASIARFLADAPADTRAQVAGIHIEGPFLSAVRCGAHDPAHMTDPDPALLRALIVAAKGWLRVMTLAPERSGAIEMVTQLVSSGIIAAIGHTDATAAQTSAAIAYGARLATHLANGMRPFHHREPGPMGACLAHPDVVCELIADGHHLHPDVVRLAAAAKGLAGIALITDAIAAAGSGDGRYDLGAREVEVSGGVARLAGGGSLAGSTLTMDAAVRNAVSWGIPITTVSRAASLTPARLLGLGDETGSIEPGRRADLVVLDESLQVVAVVARGRVVHGELGTGAS